MVLFTVSSVHLYVLDWVATRGNEQCFLQFQVSVFPSFFLIYQCVLSGFFTSITSDQCDMGKSLLRVQLMSLFIISTWPWKIIALEKVSTQERIVIWWSWSWALLSDLCSVTYSELCLPSLLWAHLLYLWIRAINTLADLWEWNVIEPNR